MTQGPLETLPSFHILEGPKYGIKRLCIFKKISYYDHFDFMIRHSNINVYHVMKKSEKWGIRDSIIKYCSQHHLGEPPSYEYEAGVQGSAFTL